MISEFGINVAGIFFTMSDEGIRSQFNLDRHGISEQTCIFAPAD